jgi:hypothetical protein
MALQVNQLLLRFYDEPFFVKFAALKYLII